MIKEEETIVNFENIFKDIKVFLKDKEKETNQNNINLGNGYELMIKEYLDSIRRLKNNHSKNICVLKVTHFNLLASNFHDLKSYSIPCAGLKNFITSALIPIYLLDNVPESNPQIYSANNNVSESVISKKNTNNSQKSNNNKAKLPNSELIDGNIEDLSICSTDKIKGNDSDEYMEYDYYANNINTIEYLQFLDKGIALSGNKKDLQNIFSQNSNIKIIHEVKLRLSKENIKDWLKKSAHKIINYLRISQLPQTSPITNQDKSIIVLVYNGNFLDLSEIKKLLPAEKLTKTLERTNEAIDGFEEKIKNNKKIECLSTNYRNLEFTEHYEILARIYLLSEAILQKDQISTVDKILFLELNYADKDLECLEVLVKENKLNNSYVRIIKESLSQYKDNIFRITSELNGESQKSFNLEELTVLCRIPEFRKFMINAVNKDTNVYWIDILSAFLETYKIILLARYVPDIIVSTSCLNIMERIEKDIENIKAEINKQINKQNAEMTEQKAEIKKLTALVNLLQKQNNPGNGEI